MERRWPMLGPGRVGAEASGALPRCARELRLYAGAIGVGRLSHCGTIFPCDLSSAPALIPTGVLERVTSDFVRVFAAKGPGRGGFLSAAVAPPGGSDSQITVHQRKCECNINGKLPVAH